MKVIRCPVPDPDDTFVTTSDLHVHTPDASPRRRCDRPPLGRTGHTNGCFQRLGDTGDEYHVRSDRSHQVNALQDIVDHTVSQHGD